MEIIEYVIVGIIGGFIGLNIASIVFFIIDAKRKNNKKNKKHDKL